MKATLYKSSKTLLSNNQPLVTQYPGWCFNVNKI